MNTITESIQVELRRVEREQGVRALFAAESGARVWGYASRDSGHAVRFIYAQDCAAYRSAEKRRDVIAETTPAGLDLEGWDLPRALEQLRASNPTLREWIKSPIVYRADPAFALMFGLLAAGFHSSGHCFRHYLRAARENFRVFRSDGPVPLRAYLDGLRPLLAGRWIEQGFGAVPVRFETLVDGLIGDANLRFHIAVLVARKRAGGELDEAQRIPALDAFIAGELARLEKIVPVAGAEPETEKLNQFFHEFCPAEAA